MRDYYGTQPQERTGANEERRLEQEGCRYDDGLTSQVLPPLIVPDVPPHLMENYAWYEIDESSEVLLRTLSPEARGRMLRLNALPGPRRYKLGRFQLDEYRLVVFEAVPQLHEVAYSEVGAIPPGGKADDLANDYTPSPTRRFLELTDRTVPVPQLLIDLDEQSDDEDLVRDLRKRDIVDTFGDGLARQADMPVATPGATASLSSAYCGSNGASAFASATCAEIGSSFCDSGAWFHNIRTSGTSRRKVSHSRTAACGSETWVWHYYRGWNLGWKWYKVAYPYGGFMQVVPPDPYYHYWKHVGGVKRRRRIERQSLAGLTGPNFFRAWSAFYN